MKSIRRDRNGVAPLIIGILIIVVAVVIIIAMFALGFFQSGPDTNTQNCPSGQCSPGQPTVVFAVDVSIQGCQPWFANTQPQITGLTAYDSTSGPPASLNRGDLFSTNMDIWAKFDLVYPSGSSFTWTSTKYNVNAGNGACSNTIQIIGYFTGPPGTYSIGATGYSQATNCWPSACAVGTTTWTPSQFSL